MNLPKRSSAAFTLAFLAAVAVAQTQPMTPDIPPKFEPPRTNYDYVKRVEMVPMRDGVTLYTFIVIPKGAKQRTHSFDAHSLQCRQARTTE
jgi:predicted acyl esterase